MSRRINQYAPNITNGEDGFTVLAFTKEAARKEILLCLDAEDFDGIELVGSWDLDDWYTQDVLELQK
jgi:hypothetical protein